MNKYKVGDKIVLEITDEISVMEEPDYILSDATVVNKGYIDKAAEPLGTYTEPLEAKIRRQAEEITRLLAENKELKNKEQELTRERNQLMGRCGGLSAARIKKFNDGRLAGQNEAWELVRKIFDMETNDIEDIFIKEDAWNLGTVLNNYTYQEAAAKVEAWEKAKEEIKVGDVVSHEEKYGVVISEGTICFRGFTDDGTPFEWYKERCTKTGRHIDIGSFLRQIGEE